MKIDGIGTNGYRLDLTSELENKKVKPAVYMDTVSFGSSIMGIFEENKENSSILGQSEQTLESLKAKATVLKDNLNAIFNKMDTGSLVKMDEEGIDINNTESDKMVTVVEQIQIKLAMYCDDFETTVNVDAESVEQIMGQGAVAYEISKKMSESGVIPTKENVSEALLAMDTASQLSSEISDTTKVYLLKNNLTPSIRNMYIAEHAGNSYGQTKNLSVSEWSGLQVQVNKIIEKSGLDINEANINKCKWLVENNIAVTSENLHRLSELEDVSGQLETDKLLDRIIATMIEGQKASSTLITGEALPWEETAMAIETLKSASPGNIMAWIKSDLPYTLEGLSDIEIAGREMKPDYEDNKFIKVTREIQEIRLMMTIDAGRILERNGISINTTEISALVEELRRVELSQFNSGSKEELSLYKESDVVKANDAVVTFMMLQKEPAAVLGSVVNAGEPANINNLVKFSYTTRIMMEKAGEAYEALSTEIRGDLGDSVSKAIKASMKDILSNLGYDDNEANRRAVRILAYNSMEFNETNMDKVKMLDESANTLFERMTPENTLQMIRDGINPLETEINILSEYLIMNQLASRPKEEKYSEFLLRMEDNNAITEEEREKFIGIYSLAHRFKTDGMNAIGSLMQQGLEFNMGNLLSAYFSRKDTGMELIADDKSETVSLDDKVTYYKNLFGKAADKITPDKLAGINNLESMPIEEFIDNIMTDSHENDVVYERMYENFKEASDYPENVYKFVSENNVTSTLNNIIAANGLLKDFGKVFEKYDNLAEEEFDKNVMNALDNKEQLDEEYEKITLRTKEIIEQFTYREKTYANMEALRMLGKQINMIGILSKQNHFCIPYKTDENKGVIHLKVVESDNESGIFNIKMKLKNGTNITVEGKVEFESIRACIMYDDKTVENDIEEIAQSIKKELEGNNFTNVKLSINNISEQPDGMAKRDDSVTTSNIFKAAKIFIYNLTK